MKNAPRKYFVLSEGQKLSDLSMSQNAKKHTFDCHSMFGQIVVIYKSMNLKLEFWCVDVYAFILEHFDCQSAEGRKEVDVQTCLFRARLLPNEPCGDALRDD